MTRRIHCMKCANLQPLHPEDVAMGWKRRQVILRTKKPDDHFIAIGGVKHQLSSLLCDLCTTPIKHGEEAVAITMWRPEREPEPECWEREFQTNDDN